MRANSERDGRVTPRYRRSHLTALCLLLSANSVGLPGQELTVIRQLDHPVLTIHSAGAEKNKYGFEGGRVVKLNGIYHLFTSEMVGDPHWVKMKLAHWTSRDRVHWQRKATIRESTGDFTGRDPRAALWSPIPIFDPRENRWNLFYVAYQAAPDTKTEWLANYEGRIWRAVSEVAGPGGIDGPFRDVEIVMERGPDSDSWEGLQGTDSFFPYSVGDHWYAFYGSAHTERLPVSLWQVGLAQASDLGGPWKRLTELNPLKVEPVFIENPIVTRLANGRYIALYDNADRQDQIGYTLSADGVHWRSGQHLVVQSGKRAWASEVRTPLGLIDEGNGLYTLFYTAYQRIKGIPSGAAPGSLGVVHVRLLKSENLPQERGDTKAHLKAQTMSSH